MRLPGRPSCDTTPNEFGVVNLVAEHDEAAHQKLSGHGHFRFLAIATMDQSLIETFQVRIPTTGCLARLVEQETQQARTFFTDAAQPSARSGRVFHRVQTGIGNYLPGGTEAGYRGDGVAHHQSGEQTDARMRPQQFYLFIAGGRLFQGRFQGGDALIQLRHHLQPFFPLLPQHWRQCQGLAVAPAHAGSAGPASRSSRLPG